MLNTIRRFVREEDGPTATEYAIMLALVVVVSIAAISLLGTKVNGVFQDINSRLDAGGAGGGN